MLKSIFNHQLKSKRGNPPRRNSGFTLIELLVAMIIAALVITPLLGLMINILSTDRNEQAKATSEQQIKDALDYIAADLKQAIYIYDHSGLSQIHNSDPTIEQDGTIDSGINDQIPPIADATGCTDDTQCIPVLVFWKREYKSAVVPVGSNNVNICSTDPDQCNDAFVYSLVGYYLITTPDQTWSNTARIGRFEVSGSITRPNPSNPTTTEIIVAGDAGFDSFDLSLSGTLKQKMNQWTKDTPDFGSTTQVLVDYIDKTANVPPGVPSGTTLDNAFCQGQLNSTQAQLVPQNTNIENFYACVDSGQNIAKIYLRGNALARIQPTDNEYTASRSTFFPSANIVVEARGFLNAD